MSVDLLILTRFILINMTMVKVKLQCIYCKFKTFTDLLTRIDA